MLQLYYLQCKYQFQSLIKIGFKIGDNKQQVNKNDFMQIYAYEMIICMGLWFSELGGAIRLSLHVKICDNLLHILSDLNDTTCPRPLRGTVADLAVFVVAGGALSCYYDSWGSRRWRQGCRVSDLRSSVMLWTLHISRPIYMCVWLYCAILFANVFYVYLSNKRLSDRYTLLHMPSQLSHRISS